MHYREQSGFTLVELLVVSLLLAVMSGILYGSVTGILGGRSAIKSQRTTSTLAQFIIEKMSRDLTSRELVPLSGGSSSSQQPTAGGFRGFGARKYFEGTNGNKNSSANDSIRFVTNNLPQVATYNTPNFGIIEVGYRLDKPKNRQSNDRVERFVLIRDEVPAEIDQGNKAIRESKAHALTLADNVAGLNFRYLLDGNWVDSWESAARPLPEAIEVSLELLDEDDELHLFKTAIFVSKQQRRRGQEEQQ